MGIILTTETWVFSEGFGAKSFPFKFDGRKIKLKIHSIPVDLHHLECL